MTLLPESVIRHPRLVLVIACLALWLPGIFLVPATDRDESRFVQATKQMLDTGDFVDIRNGTEARNRKPIGIYWLQAPGAAVARAFGVARENPVWPYRLPSLLGALTGVLATFAIGRRMAGIRAGFLGAAMLGGSVLLTTEATIAKTDAALLGATTLAMAVLARAYLHGRAEGDAPVGRGAAALFWLAMGAGILIKGPLTPMVAGLTVLALVLADRRASWLAALRPAWGVPVMLAVVLPWFVAIGIATHGQFFHDAVGGDLAGKLAGGDDAHGAPPGTHLLLLSLTLFPSGAAVLSALPSAWRGRREAATRFLLAWILPSWIVFEAVPTKLPHYPLPLFPALCVLGAAWLVSPARWSPPRWFAAAAVALSTAAAAVLGIGAAVLPFVTLRAVAWADLLGLPAILAAGLIAAILLRVRDAYRASLLALAVMPLLSWSLLAWLLPRDGALWNSANIRRLVDALPQNGGFAAVGYAEPSLMFLCGTDTLMLPGGAAGAQFLAAAPNRIVLVEGRTEAAFRQAASDVHLHLITVGAVDGFNYSNGRRVVLSLYERMSGTGDKPP